MSVERINTLSNEQARNELLRCCHSARWVENMLARRPFASFAQLLTAAESAFADMEAADWLEAFAGHPKIGDMSSLRTKYANTSEWSFGEQSGVNEAHEEVLTALANSNTIYEQRFGFIFIVCATGKSALQMLEILQTRINNDPHEELKIAANEQSKITQIRLEKLCQEVPSQHTF